MAVGKALETRVQPPPPRSPETAASKPQYPCDPHKNLSCKGF